MPSRLGCKGTALLEGAAGNFSQHLRTTAFKLTPVWLLHSTRIKEPGEKSSDLLEEGQLQSSRMLLGINTWKWSKQHSCTPCSLFDSYCSLGSATCIITSTGALVRQLMQRPDCSTSFVLRMVFCPSHWYTLHCHYRKHVCQTASWRAPSPAKACSF